MMENTVKNENPMGYEPIGKLLRKFAIPSIIAMLVNSIYNIVDQIFIGQGVGYLGNAATTVALPISNITLAVAMLIGVGGNAFAAIKLGEKKKGYCRSGNRNCIPYARSCRCYYGDTYDCFFNAAA